MAFKCLDLEKMYSKVFDPKADLTCADTSLLKCICYVGVETPVLFSSNFISEGVRTYKIVYVNAILCYRLVDFHETLALFHFIWCCCL